MLPMVALLCISPDAAGQSTYDDERTPAGWAWSQLKRGEPADFNARCGTEVLDARNEKDERWTARCRLLPASFIADVLTKAPWRDQLPSSGLWIAGARIDLAVDLRYAKLQHALRLIGCRIDAGADLYGVRTDSDINIMDSRIVGNFTMENARSDMSIDLRNTELRSGLSLTDAKIDGFVDLSGVALTGSFKANRLRLGSNLLMWATEQQSSQLTDIQLAGANVSGNVSLHGADVSGYVSLGGASVSGNVSLHGANVSGYVRLAGANVSGNVDLAFANVSRDVDLTFANVRGNVYLDGAQVSGNIEAGGMVVGGSLLMRSQEQYLATFQNISLRSAKATAVELDGATIHGNVDADGLDATSHLSLRRVVAVGPIKLTTLRIATNFDIRGATLAGLDLTASQIDGELHLAGHGWSPVTWRTGDGQPGELTLLNTRVRTLIDSPRAWPVKGRLHLDGFTFSRIGGLRTWLEADVSDRGAQWWDDWVRRDARYSPTPYEQLAAAFIAAGDRNAADDIRFLGQVRQRETYVSWDQWQSWVLSGFLQYVAGFGIGEYTFRVLYWVVAISTLGAIYLWTSVPAARAHGQAWCFGAAVNRLLPIIEINKEFSNFFDDPDRKRLTGWQSFVFSVIALVGWLLGAILVAAISGLTQNA
jgi:uncharacterized protein YjbI with pentapeptide repeats